MNHATLKGNQLAGFLLESHYKNAKIKEYFSTTQNPRLHLDAEDEIFQVG
jgi:hypothetical protein